MSKHVNNPFPKCHVPWNKGKRGVYTEQVLLAWSKKRKGVKASLETRKKMSVQRRGEKHPLWGRPRSEETKEKLRKHNTRDVIHSEEFCKIVSEKLNGKTVKICSKCKIEKEFCKFGKDLRKITGLQSQCQICQREKRQEWVSSNPEYARMRHILRMQEPEWIKKRAEYDAKYRKKKFVSDREKMLLKKYKITVDHYNQLLLSQNGVCAICESDKNSKSCKGGLKSFAVDHCHKSEKIRGLLCDRCNRGIGLFKDNRKVLIKAARYLKRNGTNG